MKRCCACKEHKPLSNFNKNKSTKDGLTKRCVQCSKEYNAIWYSKNETTVKLKRSNYLINQYWPNLTRENALKEYEQLKKSQNNSCAICKDPFIDSKRPDIDHDHETGQVRGLLCNTCNRGIGYLKDSPINILNAYDYLKKFKP